MIPVTVAVLVFAVSYLRFLFHLPLTFRVLFSIAGFVYVAGALGLEIVGQLYGISHNRKNFGYNMIATGEEMLEMSGIVILIYALLKYISVTMRDVSIRIGSQVQN